jgi:Ni/Fe-hydrogenase 1 B-type cytochrome subunit
MGKPAEFVSGQSKYQLVQVRTPFVCLLHWVIVGSVVTLAVTGLYIGNPKLLFGSGEAYATFVMAKVRFYHFLAVTGLIVSLLLRLYYSFSPATRSDIWEIIPTPGNIKGAFRLAIFYLTGKGEHYHYRYLNPLGGISVFTMICLFGLMIATGFTLFSQQSNSIIWTHMYWFTNLVERVFGGMNNVRFAHHLVMYCLMSMVVIHVYMKIYADILFKEADIASIIAGYKIFRKDVIALHKDRYEGRV